MLVPTLDHFKNTVAVVVGIILEIKTISFDLLKVMIPVLLAIKALELSGATRYLAELIAPTMSSLGLPSQMGIVWAGTMVSNIYTGMVLFVSEPSASTYIPQLDRV